MNAETSPVIGPKEKQDEQARIARQHAHGTFMSLPDQQFKTDLNPMPVFEVSLPTQDTYGAGRILARWSGAGSGFPVPPRVGDVVRLTINSIGLGTVKGYFVESGFLGVKVTPHNPPAWWTKQNPTRSLCTVFGVEISTLRWVIVRALYDNVLLGDNGKPRYFKTEAEAREYLELNLSPVPAYKPALESEVSL